MISRLLLAGPERIALIRQTIFRLPRSTASCRFQSCSRKAFALSSRPPSFAAGCLPANRLRQRGLLSGRRLRLVPGRPGDPPHPRQKPGQADQAAQEAPGKTHISRCSFRGFRPPLPSRFPCRSLRRDPGSRRARRILRVRQARCCIRRERPAQR